MRIREFLTTWGFDVDFNTLQKMDAKIGQIRNEAKGLGQNINEVSAGIRNIGAGLTAFITLPVSLLGGALIKSASDAEETFSKFDTVFKDVSTSAENTANNLSKNFGLSSLAAKQLLSDTGDLLSGFGFTGEMALDVSKKVNELAVDLASFTNFSGGAEGASQALTKALLGERESVKSLGIAILEEDVKARVAQLRAMGQLEGMTERQAKAYATLSIAQEQSKNAIGDYARTQASFANRMRVVRARIEDVAVGFGKILLPIATKVANKAVVLIEKFNGLSEQTKTLILILGGIVAVIGPALLIIGLMGQATIGLIQGYKMLATTLGIAKTALLSFNLSALALPLIIAAIIAAIALVGQDLIAFANDQPSLIGKILNAWEPFSEGSIFRQIGDFIDNLINGFKKFGDTVSGVFDMVSKAYENSGLKNIVDSVSSFFGSVAGKAVSLFESATGEAARPRQERSFWDTITGSNYGAVTVPANELGNSRSTVNNVSTNVNLTVPPGTSAEQAEFLQEQMERVANETLNSRLTQTLNQIPEHD
ncbi:MAG: phage tail tape measure protein [Gammaproteobacteria bacterium]|nr:phage tail tape measure protein [Gammaproteobacteria bacterium]